MDSGDDCAVLRVNGEDVLFKVDSIVEGVHFCRGDPLAWVGHKAVARPLSDIAAMGGLPVAAVAAAVLPRSFSMAQARRLQLGMERLGLPIVGGDVTTHRGPLAISVSILGVMRGVRPVLRRGARPGDAVLVTGPLGGSLRRGHHLRFTPKLREGRLFATRFRVRAMIDISDGLARDLGHLCEVGDVGAELDAERIPRVRGASLEEALRDGEDYELLAAADATTAARIVRQGLAFEIGRITRSRQLVLTRGSRRVRLDPRGYEHRLR